MKFIQFSLIIASFLLIGCEGDDFFVKVKSKWIDPSKNICITNGGEIRKIDKIEVCTANWTNAKKICAKSGERLPTIEELNEVVTDCMGEMKSNNSKDYQNCYKKRGFTWYLYWSSTIYAKDSPVAWHVLFSSGLKGYGSELNNIPFRCVRIRE